VAVDWSIVCSLLAATKLSSVAQRWWMQRWGVGGRWAGSLFLAR